MDRILTPWHTFIPVERLDDLGETTKDLHRHGEPPYRVVVVHGGPGARGEMRPVARRLALRRGVLEPLQAADSLDGQVTELAAAIEEAGEPPVTLVGFSWGAWLGWVLAARHPGLVRKLVLVGCPPFDERFAAEATSTRLARLDDEGARELESLLVDLDASSSEGKDRVLAGLGALLATVDAYEPLPDDDEVIDCRYKAHRGPWEDAARLRREGGLLSMGEGVECPVVAIHGDHDPHPAEGVREALSSVLEDFDFVLLERCGHRPWVERWAHEPFFRELEKELGDL